MKKLTLTLVLLLSGCLNTTNHNPMKRKYMHVDADCKDGCDMAVDVTPDPWWQAKVMPGTPDNQNPWMKFVKVQPEDRWYDPWSKTDLKAYGVTPIHSAAHATPLKDAKIRMLKLEIEKLKRVKRQGSSLNRNKEVY